MTEEPFTYEDLLVTEGGAMRVAEPGRPGYSFEPVSGRIVRAAVQVHRILGPGFREDVYLNALCVEFEKQGLSFRTQVDYPVFYEGRRVGNHVLDLLVEETVIVELKAVSGLLEVHHAQLMAYLRAAHLRIGLLVNFGQMPIGIKRILNGYQR